MKIIIGGGSGFIGQNIADVLIRKNNQVIVLDIKAAKGGIPSFQIDLAKREPPQDILRGTEAVINLAGDNIFRRWDKGIKDEIYNSRILATRNLVSAIGKMDRRPKVFISASAVGFYGDRAEEFLDESLNPGKDFLAKVCIDWEAEAEKVKAIRKVLIRTAPVLGKGGFLKIITTLYDLGLGGPICGGHQWFSWIHIEDIVNVYVYALENEAVSGAINASSPRPARNEEFSHILADVLGKPSFLRVPKFALKLLLGEFSDITYSSQKVNPKKLMETGYVFKFPELRGALTEIFRKDFLS